MKNLLLFLLLLVGLAAQTIPPGVGVYSLSAGSGSGGGGTVTSIPDGSTNGVTWTVATRTTTPTFTFSLGAITPTSIAIGADPADAGDLRLSNGGIIGWEASPAGTDVTLTVNSSEQFVFSNAILSPTFITPTLGAATATSVTITNTTVADGAGALSPAVGSETNILTFATSRGVNLPSAVDGNSFRLFFQAADGIASITFSGNVYREGDPDTAFTVYTPGPAGNHSALVKMVNSRWMVSDDTFSVNYAQDAGSTDAYVITPLPAFTAYTTGGYYRFKANTANTGAATININGLGAKTIVKAAGGITTTLADNDIRAGQWVDLTYDGTNMQMQSLLGNSASASPGGSTTQVQYNLSSAFAGSAKFTYVDPTLTLDQPGAAATVLTSLQLNNSTASTVGVTGQNSGAVEWDGSAWKSNATAASQAHKWRAYIVPATGTSSTTSSWIVDANNNGGGFNNIFYADTNGDIHTGQTGGAYMFGGSRSRMTSPADNQVKFTGSDTVTGAQLQFGTAVMTGKTTTYNNVATAGWGVPAVYAAGRVTAQTAAAASIATYTCGAADGSFEVSGNVLVTASTTHAFTMTCAYTDEGNTARVLTFTFSNIGGTLVTSIANAGGAVPYEGVPLHIRVKASTAITIATAAGGVYTSVTYNAEGIIRQLN